MLAEVRQKHGKRNVIPGAQGVSYFAKNERKFRGKYVLTLDVSGYLGLRKRGKAGESRESEKLMT